MRYDCLAGPPTESTNEKKSHEDGKSRLEEFVDLLLLCQCSLLNIVDVVFFKGIFGIVVIVVIAVIVVVVGGNNRTVFSSSSHGDE